jgi:hypothetical protein
MMFAPPPDPSSTPHFPPLSTCPPDRKLLLAGRRLSRDGVQAPHSSIFEIDRMRLETSNLTDVPLGLSNHIFVVHGQGTNFTFPTPRCHHPRERQLSRAWKSRVEWKEEDNLVLSRNPRVCVLTPHDIHLSHCMVLDLIYLTWNAVPSGMSVILTVGRKPS